MLTFDERLLNLEMTVGPIDEADRLRELINQNEWRYAKTYDEFCPHWYTLRRTWKDKKGYADLIHHIWLYGLDAFYGKAKEPKRYWFDHKGGWYYFIFGEDTDEQGNATEKTMLLNRAKIGDFKFWVEDDLFGPRVNCKTLPSWQRITKPASWNPDKYKGDKNGSL